MSDKCRGAIRKPRDSSQCEDRRVCADIDVIGCAQPGERFGHVERIQLAGPFIHHIGGNRSKTFATCRIGAGTHVDLHDECHDRQARVLHCADVEPVTKPVPDNGRKHEGRVRADGREA